MVSNASEDLPDPDRPVMTTSCSRGMSRSTPLRLCSRAPRTRMKLCFSVMGSGNAEDPETVRGDDAIWGSIRPIQQEQYKNFLADFRRPRRFRAPIAFAGADHHAVGV